MAIQPHNNPKDPEDMVHPIEKKKKEIEKLISTTFAFSLMLESFSILKVFTYQSEYFFVFSVKSKKQLIS